jgi:F-box domain
MALVLPECCTENQPEHTNSERSEATWSDFSSPLVQLPDDALQTVCEHLPPTAVAALGACCRRLRDATGAGT